MKWACFYKEPLSRSNLKFQSHTISQYKFTNKFWVLEVENSTKKDKKKEDQKLRNMPCLYISTNVNLDGVDTDSIFSEATKAISAITGKPENFVMVVLKGSVPISFGKSTTIPASYGELVAMGGITTAVKRQLIATLGTIFESKLSIPKTRFFLKVVDLSTPTGSRL